MINIALPSHSLRGEEKRNLLLRLKYGSQCHGLSHSHGEGDFVIEGHMMVHKPRVRIVPKLPDYGRKGFFKPIQAKNMTMNIASKKLLIRVNTKPENLDEFSRNSLNQQSAQAEADDKFDLDQRFAYTSLRKGSNLEAVHEHDEERNGQNISSKTLNQSADKNRLPDISNSYTRKMSFSRKYSKDSDIDFFKKSASRSGSFSSYTSDKFQTKVPLNRRRTRRWKSKESGIRRASKDDSQDYDVTVRYKLRENLDENKSKHIWFDYPGLDLTFVDVQEAIEKVIPDAFTANKVLAIQFENVNVKQGGGMRENRWHIELKDFTTKDKLLDSDLELRKPNMRKKQTSVIKRPSVSRNEM